MQRGPVVSPDRVYLYAYSRLVSWVWFLFSGVVVVHMVKVAIYDMQHLYVSIQAYTPCLGNISILRKVEGACWG